MAPHSLKGAQHLTERQTLLAPNRSLGHGASDQASDCHLDSLCIGRPVLVGIPDGSEYLGSRIVRTIPGSCAYLADARER